MVPSTAAKPTATATIEPMGQRTKVPRDHSIKVVVKLSALADRYADRAYAANVVRTSLAGFPPASGEPDRRGFGEVSESKRFGKPGNFNLVVVGAEGSVVWPGRPEDDSVERVRAALLGEGYRVTVREKRECAEPACTTYVMIDWNRPAAVPAGWYSSLVCGKHNYRTCSGCKSIYVLTSLNAAGQAPSVPCEVCGVLLIGWGSSKVWSAELVTRGEAIG